MTRQTWLPIVFLLVAGAAQADPLPRAELRNVAVNALVAGVHLDVPTAERVQSVVDRYRDSILAARIDSTTTLRELRLLLRNQNPDERRLKKLNEALITHRAQLHKLQDERVRDMGKILTPAQFGRLLASWRAVDRAIQREARRS